MTMASASDAPLLGTLYLDVETTGVGSFRPPTQRLLQLAWILDSTGPVRETSHLISDVDSDVSPHVPHDITIEKCRKTGVPFDAAFDALLADLRLCGTVVAHNLDFDWGTLLNELRLRGRPASDLTAAAEPAVKLCTMKSTTGLCRLPKAGTRFTGFKYPTLRELHVKVVGGEPAERLHDALNDCRVLRRCHVALRASYRLAELGCK